MSRRGRQFRILYRDGLLRMLDPEILAGRGDISILVSQWLGMLCGASFVLTLLLVTRYWASSRPRAELLALAWSDEEFLLAATMTLAGLFAVAAWNSLFPDRRDSFILGQLPVELAVQMAAKLCALVTALVGAIAGLCSFTGIAFPLTASPPRGIGGGLWALGSWWLTHCLAALFVLATAMALQGWAAQLLPWPVFQRISGLLQLGFLVGVLGLFFLAPALTLRGGSPAVPSHWFTGLLHGLYFDANPRFTLLRQRALWGLAVVVPLALAASALAWYRNMRRMVEAPELAPSRRSCMGLVAGLLAQPPAARAILLFTARTLSRSSRHRLLIFAYLGAGLGMALVFSRSFFATGNAGEKAPPVALMSGGLLVMACAIVSVRVTFGVPASLPANWIFRVAAGKPPGVLLRHVRHCLYVMAALPAWLLLAAFYASAWPGRRAAAHMIFLAAFAFWLTERSVALWRKIPYTCSWLPGGLQSRLKSTVFGILFLVAAQAVAGIELWTMQNPSRFAVLIAIVALAGWRSRFANRQAWAEPLLELQFEEHPPADVHPLDLRGAAEASLQPGNSPWS